MRESEKLGLVQNGVQNVPEMFDLPVGDCPVIIGVALIPDFDVRKLLLLFKLHFFVHFLVTLAVWNAIQPQDATCFFSSSP